MIISTSVLAELTQALPQLRQQLYFKSSLTALSHAMEDQVLAGTEHPLVIASFQRERFYRQEAHRYKRIAERTSHTYVLAAPETDFKNSSGYYETIAFDPRDSLSQEWHLVVIGQQYTICLVCRERTIPVDNGSTSSSTNAEMDPSRRFEGIWTFDRQVGYKAAELLLERILAYRPELADKIEQARETYGITTAASQTLSNQAALSYVDPDPFVQRLVTYLQAGQYKLLKAYRSITAQEQKERLVNSITVAIRQSLDPEEILQVAVEELGQAMEVCRCLIYRAQATDETATINHEFLAGKGGSMAGQTLPLQQDNPLFQEVLKRRERVYVANTQTDKRLTKTAKQTASGASLKRLFKQYSITSLLMVPVLYQGRLLGMVELHNCGEMSHEWKDDDLALVDAIATQVGVALIQAEAYANLEDLNQQLAALDRTRSNLVAITGHELRTPLSTIQVCLESLAQEPDMSLELRQVMLNTALTDAERMRKLVQDFLTLSRLESGRVEWHPEVLSLPECVELALSNIRARRSEAERPKIITQVPKSLPLVRVDGEWLVEVLAKLLDNACKFTPPNGQVTIKAQQLPDAPVLKVTVADTGRGIETNRLETVFDRFYQEEGALRRTTGGTGLGLAICRQIVNSWDGEIWAESSGKDRGSQFHFTVPVASGDSEPTTSLLNSGRSLVGYQPSTTRPQFQRTNAKKG
jgi:DICT domain-containing protein/signal transduction histidine kinase